VIRKMGQYLKMNVVVPEQYIDGFVRANNTFLYQLVFDPGMRKVVPLNPYPEHIDPASLSYAGINLGDDKGLDVALGNLDINTMERIDDFSPDHPQSCKARSHNWGNSPASAGISIWSKSFTPASAGPSCPAAYPEKPPSTRGKERVMSLEHLRLQDREQKRPREDSYMSDQEVLQQYSGVKRSKLEEQEYKQTLSSQPRLRNCFAFTTLLQRRNHHLSEDTGSQPTRSRFFSSSSSATTVSTKESTEGLKPTAEGSPQDRSSLSESDSPDVPPVETPSPPVSPDSIPSASARLGLKVFQWSGSSPLGLVALQQFEYKREISSSLQTTCQLSGDFSSPEINSENKDYPSDSPPSQDSAYFSQSQSTSLHKEEVFHYSCSFSSQEKTSSEPTSIVDLEPRPESPASFTETCRKPGMLGSKVSGLSKLKSSIRNQAVNTPALGPAKASGLRKKAVGSGKKGSSTNNENNPGVQATISSLWKNFSYKRETPKISSSKKGEPMSPVKDNLLNPQPT
ncbi:hypothetical protein XENOCAPTIV_000053, partial [Xenoophorus captivus]